MDNFRIETILEAHADQIKALQEQVKTLQSMLEGQKAALVYGSKRTWNADQHKFLLEKYNETNDLDELCEAVNTEFGPRGYVERSPTAIACQLYKLVAHEALTKKIIAIGERYIK